MRPCAAARSRMVFQEPMTSLNPVFTVGDADRRGPARSHGLQPGARRAPRAVEMLDHGRHPRARRAASRSTRTSSPAGMRQRVMIAMALACEPHAAHRRRAHHRARRHGPGPDPRPARAAAARARHGLLLITHDLGVVAEIADRVVVMYAGRVVEAAPGLRCSRDPRHPYTRRCWPARRRRAPGRRADRPRRLDAIDGIVPISPRWLRGVVSPTAASSGNGTCRRLRALHDRRTVASHPQRRKRRYAVTTAKAANSAKRRSRASERTRRSAQRRRGRTRGAALASGTSIESVSSLRRSLLAEPDRARGG